MAALTDYTSTEAVIGALGLTDNEIEPDMLLDQGLDKALLVELYDWLPDHADLWAAAIAPAATAKDLVIGQTLQLYATWYCATFAARMQLAVPQRISDGKNDMRRFAVIDFKTIEHDAAARAGDYRSRLSRLVDETYTEPSVSLIGLANPTYDPVTGEES